MIISEFSFPSSMDWSCSSSCEQCESKAFSLVSFSNDLLSACCNCCSYDSLILHSLLRVSLRLASSSNVSSSFSVFGASSSTCDCIHWTSSFSDLIAFSLSSKSSLNFSIFVLYSSLRFFSCSTISFNSLSLIDAFSLRWSISSCIVCSWYLRS